MTVKEFLCRSGFSEACMPCPEREIKGAYVGDLLSWVMGRAGEGNIWITIMSNINVAAVASLTDVSCVVLAEGVTLDGEILAAANEKGINVLLSDAPAYETAVQVGRII